MRTLKGKTLFVTGGSRGIGLAIARRVARDGANVVIAAKTAEPHPKLPGTIYTAAEEIEAAGGKALPLQMDLREDEQIHNAVNEAVAHFGGIDMLLNNASAINLTGTLETPMKRFDLMFDINIRGTFAASQACLPHLIKSNSAHILTLSPPLNMNPEWFAPHVAYTMAKYGMSMCVLGMAREFRGKGVAVNALWPRTVIHTAALNQIPGAEIHKTRKPEIMADAAYSIFTREASGCSGNFFIDDEALQQAGITDLDQYAVEPGNDLLPDLFL